MPSDEKVDGLEGVLSLLNGNGNGVSTNIYSRILYIVI